MLFRNRSLPCLNNQNLEAFNSRVDKKSQTECWPWTGSITKATNKPFIKIKDVNCLAYRYAYFLYYGIDPQGQQIWHTCKNSICCNPHHLTTEPVYEQNQDLKDERWLPVPVSQYSKDYSVSNYGRIRRESGQYKGHISTGRLNSSGYMFFVLRQKPHRAMKFVHRLVACAFLNNGQDSALFVNHIEGVKTNNHVDNLELVTFSENINHAYKSGLMPSGEKHTWAKLTANDVRQIRDDFDLGRSNINRLAKKYKVAFDTIKFIVRRQTWKHI